MKVFIIQVAISLLIQASLLFETSAYPGQAGHCNAGPINEQNTPNPHASFPSSPYGGALSQGSLKFTVDGNEELSNIETNKFVAGQEYTFRIESNTGTPVAFKGILIRLEPLGTDDPSTIDAFDGATIDGFSSGIKPHPTCEIADIASLTHNNRLDKRVIEFKFKVDATISQMRLDVTILKTQSFGNWYYNSYILSTGSDDPTASPPNQVPSSVPTRTFSEPSKQPASVSGDKYACGSVDDDSFVEVPGGSAVSTISRDLIKSDSNVLCMLFRITVASDTASLDDISPSANLADFNMVPVSRSYDNSDWKRVAGPYAQGLTAECSGDVCSISIPHLSNLVDGKFVLMSFQHELNNAESISRFFHYTTFGPTRNMISALEADAESNGLQSTFAQWVNEQILDTSATPHREFYRKKIDGYISKEAEQTRSDPPVWKARSPCDLGSRWAEYAFTSDEIGRWHTVEVTRRSGGDYLVKVDGVPRTLLDEWKNGKGEQLRTGKNWEFNYNVEEYLGGEVIFFDKNNFQNHGLKGGNPPIRLDFEHENVRVIQLPSNKYFIEVDPVHGAQTWNANFLFGQNLILNYQLNRNVCKRAGINYSSTNNVHGMLGGSGVRVRYARYAELDENTIQQPLSDGGGYFVDDGGMCSNPTMNFLNEESCVMTTVDNACVTNYEKGNAGDAVVVCGSPGEVANDPLDGKNTFHLGGSLMYKLNDTYQIQKHSVWFMVAMYSYDQLRQKMAWALSQILVITPNQIDEERQSEMYLNYYDIFVRNAFGNYFDILKEVSYSPMMGEMLSYRDSKSTPYVLKATENIAFPDENYAREIMQLFTIGVYKLNMDGTLYLEPESGLPVANYDNTDIQNFARAWTGFSRQEQRSNTEELRGNPNRFDPMSLTGPWRDFSPKSGLFGDSYIGDNYPLCVDEPEKAFLKKGAKYRLIGSSDTTVMHNQHWWWLYEDQYVSKRDVTYTNLSETSKLFSELCNGSPGSCNYQAVVTLDSNIGCAASDPECSVDELRVVQVQSNPPVRYEYMRTPCVKLAFYDNGKMIQHVPLSTNSEPKVAMCANSDTAAASDSCCWWHVHDSPLAKSHCAYSGERTTFHTSKQRCADNPLTPNFSKTCAWGTFWLGPGDNRGINHECHHFNDDSWWWTGEEECRLQAKVSNTGTVSIVHDPKVKAATGFINDMHTNMYNTNFFKVSWAGGAFPDPSQSCGGTSCTLLNGVECLCDIAVRESAQLYSMPDADTVKYLLKVGGVDVTKFDSEYNLGGSEGGVTVWHKNGSSYDKNTVFELENKFYKNFESLIEIAADGSDGISQYTFRNPPQFLTASEREPRDAMYETDAVLDHYFRHPNVAPFLAFRLIQRFGVSNPSPQYISAVSNAFASGFYENSGLQFGSGEYGDLAATVSAITLHEEVTNPLLDADPTSGSLREPIVKLISLMRAMELEQIAKAPYIRLLNLDLLIGQMPHASPNVFSFFLPEYAARGHIKAASITSPEAQVMTGPKLVAFLNGMFSLTLIGLTQCFGGFGEVTLTMNRCDGVINHGDDPNSRAVFGFQPSATDAAGIVDELALLLTGGRLHTEAREILISAYNEEPSIKLKTVQKLFLTLPEFHSYGIFKGSSEQRPETSTPPPSDNEYKAIVIVRLSGGADSFNMLVPHSGCDSNDMYAEYRKTRSGLAIPNDELLPIDASDSAQDCSTFGLHPNMQDLRDMYEEEDLLWIANMGVLQTYVDNRDWFWKTSETSLFAHNTQSSEVANNDIYEEQIGRGIGGRLVDLLNRNGYTANSISSDGIAEFLVSNLSSQIIVTASNFDKFDPMADFSPIPSALDKIKDLNSIGTLGSSLFGETWSTLLYESLQQNQMLFDTIQNVVLDTEFAQSGLGKQMEVVAKLIKTKETRGVDRDVFFVHQPSFDTHSDLTATFVARMTELNKAMSDMAEELKAQGKWDSVTFVMTSEFARTLTENTSAGSDHAWGGNYFLAGGGIKGKQILGGYPTSFDPDVRGGLIFAPGIVIPTTPFDSMWYGLAQWLGINNPGDLDELLPNRKAFPLNDMFTAEQLYENFVPPPTPSPIDSTPSPSPPPTSSPSDAPAETPTSAPSTSSSPPTSSPTSSPSDAPAETPTSAPSTSSSPPTSSPTSLPSAAPVETPTSAPSSPPTSSPSAAPVETPTSAPSSSPTSSPTSSPSAAPVDTPTTACEQQSQTIFFWKINSKDKPLMKKCKFLENRIKKNRSVTKYCRVKNAYKDGTPPARIACPVSCRSCPCEDDNPTTAFYYKKNRKAFFTTCDFLIKRKNKGANIARFCKLSGKHSDGTLPAKKACPKTCGLCGN